MRCPSCNHDNRAERRFCAECGSPLAALCAACGTSNEPGEKFCGGCGGALSIAPAAHPPSSGARVEAAESTLRVRTEATGEIPEGERKTVTALFADIKGSTELEQDLDPEEARAIVDPALKLMIDAVRRYDGYIVQSTGDGIFALFGAPVAHEDHPNRALYAGLRMQDELKRYSARLREAGNLPIEARVGVNTGEVVVRSISTGGGHTEYTPIGHTTNLASRMQALAPTGSIAISEQTRKLCEGYFALKPLGPTRVKGVSEPVNVYEVTGFGPLRTRLQRSAGRGLTKFVGREREMDAMRNASQLTRVGRGQIVAAMAEAGTGKSRLFFEFKAKHQSGWMVLETFSVSHGKASAYLPTLELLHGYFRITSDDDVRTRREKVNGKVLTLDRSLEDTLPYLFALLGIIEGDDPLAQMDGQVRRRRTLDAIKRILLRESLNQPLMVIFEDLHWIDDETQAFLNLLADSIGTAKILLLVNYRPEYSHQWGSKTYYTQLRLDPLGIESADEMLSAMLGDSEQLAALKKLITEKTEGNPFFMEETVQVLFDENALVRDGGVVKLTRSLAELKIPPTVQAILAARIDRLPQDAKDLLQTLAVIGREFPLSLIRAVVSIPDDETRRLLDVLQLGEFIYEQPAIGDSEYTFKHALTQEVSYNSVLMERRRQLHGRIGAALEGLYTNSIDDHLDELAHHYGRSGNSAKALDYLESAGLRAVRRLAYGEAMRNLAAALELLERTPSSPERDRREFALQTSLGPALMATKGWAAPETERAYLRAERLAETGATPEQQFALLVGLFGLLYVGGNLSGARERQKPIWDFVDRHPDPVFLLEAIHHDWSVALSAGELEAAQRHVERGLKLFESKLRSVAVPLYTAHHPAVCGYAWDAQLSWLRGRPDAARRCAERAVSLANELGDSMSAAFALYEKALVHRMMLEPKLALEIAGAAINTAEDVGFLYVLRHARVVKGWALTELGRAEEGIGQIREETDALSANREELWLTLSLATLADACLRAGRIEHGLKAIGDALDLVRRSGECFWEAEINRLRGELLLGQSPSDPALARASVEHAIEKARQQGAKSLELRATTSLARMLMSTDRRDEARAMLAGIYNWFTEGFDTADLKDAKALLEELGA
ncbi:adenylate/guanylate cyclase domain-containing protein [Candidatus Binatus sp.]|uniref:adenylate/guanylate cyclase domain-containing protein n=1 Tax=Candidatus Binatus sp. TaxID=2811406 RepID=UPI003C74BE17